MLVNARSRPRVRAITVAEEPTGERKMNSFRYFSTCLFALLSQAAFAQGLTSATSFAVLSAADFGKGAVTCTDSNVTGDVGSSGPAASIVQTRCTISGAVRAPVATNFDALYAALALKAC